MELAFRTFPRHESPGYVIYRTAIQLKVGLSREFQANGFHVTPEQWGVLSILWEKDGIHQSLLAERAAKDRHNIARILTLLEKRGLIRRTPHPEDKRCQKVYLTEQGQALKAKLIPIVTDFLNRALAGLTQDDLAQVNRILGHIVKNLTGAADPLSSSLDQCEEAHAP